MFYLKKLASTFVKHREIYKRVVFGIHSSASQYSGNYLIDSPSYSFLKDVGIERTNKGVYNGKWFASGEIIRSIDPGTGKTIAEIQTGTPKDMKECIQSGIEAYKYWAEVPAPLRGEIVRQIGDELRRYKEPLGKLVSLEVGKILSEGQGEVQEFIDICDYAMGLSRIFSGKIISSERPKHTILETWRPLGLVGIISAYNFPNAVFGWNAAIALALGNSIVWKGAESTSLISIATTKIVTNVLEKNKLPPIISLCQGSAEVGEVMVRDDRVKLLSFTGSTKTGRQIGVEVQKRFGKFILELGGNNALLINEDAQIDMALDAAVFGCIGTSGQRCTTTRRIVVHEKIYDRFLSELKTRYKLVMKKVGHQLDSGTLFGPVHSQKNVDDYLKTITDVLNAGGKIEFGGNQMNGRGFFVEPTIVTNLPHDSSIIASECFAPIVYVLKAKSLSEAISWNNEVKQGLSSAVFTQDVNKVFEWLGPNGSDCGIVNVNTTTNGAEIGGAFGGEKQTGGGRESGSDSWKQYCRRATVTINHSGELACAQGVVFNIKD